MVRETQEEVGLTLLRIHHAFDRTLQVGSETWLGHYYFAAAVRGNAVNREPTKLRTVEFVPFLEIEALPSQPGSLWEIVDSAKSRTFPHTVFRERQPRSQNGESPIRHTLLATR